MRWLAGTVCCLLLVPHGVLASVRINEVAWMGTEESYLCDWIELYNQSDAPVDITQWTFEIGDTVRTVADGEGDAATVPGRGFLLLERVTNTCPDPVPDVAGWYLALGNVPNDGTTLTLRRSDGSMADRVVGGEAWQNIGGDNDSKETAQRTSAGWVTATPTPGKENHDTATAPPDSSTSTATDDTDPAANSVRLYDPDGDDGGRRTLGDNESDLVLNITAANQTYVGQPIDLTVSPSGVGRGVARSLHYQWNFGDRHTTTQQEPTHTYTFPGTYVVTVRGTYNGYEAVARHEVTVLPVRLTLGRDQSGNIQLHNTAPYELDLSHYTVTGTDTVTLPARTILLPEQTLTLEQSEVEKEVSGLVTVRGRQNEVVASNLEMVRAEYLADAATDDPSPQVAGRVTTGAAPRAPATTTAVGTSLSEPFAATTTGRFVTEPPQATANEEEFTVADWRTRWPYAALGGLLVLTLGFLFWPSRRTTSRATTAEWFE